MRNRSTCRRNRWSASCVCKNIIAVSTLIENVTVLFPLLVKYGSSYQLNMEHKHSGVEPAALNSEKYAE